jgi:hypothetical protein
MTGLAVFWLAACCASAFAQSEPADIEPNDTAADAAGPLTSAGPWTGSLSAYATLSGTADDGTTYDYTVPDSDVYVVYVTGPGQLDLHFALGPNGYCERATLANDDIDNPVGQVTFASGNGTPGDTSVTVPAGPSRWFLRIDDNDGWCSGGDYQFSLTPSRGAALTTGPAFASYTTVTAGANSSDTAYGPLAAGTNYRAVIGSDDDEDWSYFYTTGKGQPVDVSVTSGSGGCDLWWTIDDHNIDDDNEDPPFADGREVDATTADHVAFTSTGAARYDIEIYATCSPATWQVRVDAPSGTVSTTRPPALTDQSTGSGQGPGSGSDGAQQGAGGSGKSTTACTKARRALRSARSARNRARHALLLPGSHATHHRAAIRLRAARRAIRVATARVSGVC